VESLLEDCGVDFADELILVYRNACLCK
jgi:hypothetical protein